MNELPPTNDDPLENLVGQVVDEFLERLERGEQPKVEDYAQRYPAAAEALRDALSPLLLMRSGTHIAQPPGSEAPRVLGDFRIIREVGRGGMGVVYEAEQQSLGRRVALKVLRGAAVVDAREKQRFINEAHAAAQLHHTNIVPVHYVGDERGTHYYVMQFIHGQTLASVIEELRRSAASPAETGPAESARPSAFAGSSPASESGAETVEAPTAWLASLTTQRSTRGGEYYRTVARLGIEAAEALGHAHECGIIHRDVKPGNLMVDERSHLWITDFGLAYCQADAGLTRTGSILGTPRYMSPEQTSGRRELLDHRTDVYSLGATLYELLTLEPAFAAKDQREVLRQVQQDEPLRPRRRNKAIPAELETIVLKTMEKNPNDRFKTALELAEDLRRFLADKPIRAKPPTLLQRLRKLGRRHQTTVRVAGGLLLFSLIALAFVLAWSNRQLARKEKKAQDALADNYEMTARLASQRGAWREAIDFTDKALATERYQDSVPLRLNKVRALHALNDVGRCTTEIEALAATQDLGDYEGQVLLLQADIQLGRDDARAEQLLRRALEKGLPPADEAYAKALLAETTPRAVEHLRHSLELNRYQPRARAALELLLILLARLDEAHLELAKHEETYPEDPNAKVLRAMVLGLDRDRDGADKVLEELRGTLEDADVDALRALVQLFCEFRNPASAPDPVTGLPDLTRHLATLAPVLPRLLHAPAGTGPGEVVAAHQKLFPNFPLPPQLRRGLFAVLLALSKAGGVGPGKAVDGKTIDELNQAVAVHPEGTILYVRALVLMSAMRFSEAHAAAREAAATPALLPIRRQANFLAAFSLILAYSAKKDPAVRQQIADDLRQMVAAGPLGAPFMPGEAVQLAVGVQEYGLARQLVAEWEQQAPGDPGALYHHALTELKAGSYGQALEAADKYLQQKPADEQMLRLRKEAGDKLLDQARRLAPPAGAP
jgi:serine/threonine protein kinase